MTQPAPASEAAPAPAVTIERDGRVAVIVLDRPDVLNVFSGGMSGELSAAYRECDADPEIRVIVLTGRGRAFCAGADMSPGSGSFATPGAGFSF
jgi:enoyl-CoA hydratase/carnithine racemase